MLAPNIPQGRILVAISGGADSVALLRLLHEQGCDIQALHCNFQLRGDESLRDEKFVRDLCKRMQVLLHVQCFDTLNYAKEKGISIEMAARELRYQWFEQMRQELQADFIAVAHHQEDQAETVLLNLVRGTGLRGLAGMKAENGHIIRPLLHHSKADILDYLQQIGQDYVTDSTNQERNALRNRIRLDVLPLLRQINPLATAHIAQTAIRVEEALPYYFMGIDASHDLTRTTLHERLYGLGFTPTQENNILQCINGQSGKVFESHTHRLTIHHGSIQIEKKCETNQPPTLTSSVTEVEDALAYLRSQPLTPEYAYLDADKVTMPLSFRHPQKGDRFQPYGMKKGSRLISDFLTDLHLSLFDKQNQWLACQGKDIVWIVGLRIDHRFSVTNNTRRVLALHLQ